MQFRLLVSVLPLAFASLALADMPSLTPEELRTIRRLSPLPAPVDDETNCASSEPAARALGEAMFFDKRLSADGSRACASCHDPARNWTDGLPVAQGAPRGGRNTPTLWNVAYQRWFFWDGRADSLWSQALKPLESDTELGTTRTAIYRLISSDEALRTSYERVFGRLPIITVAGDASPTAPPGDARSLRWQEWPMADRDLVDRVFANIGKALAAFEGTIRTGTAPFDAFAEGLRTGDPQKTGSISPSAIRGLRLFIGKAQCISCHNGPLFTDGEFHDIRLAPRGGGYPSDPARSAGVDALLSDPFNAAGRFSDAPAGERAKNVMHIVNQPEFWGRYRTPSLRNVALTGPYMHQGQFATLREVLVYYSTFAGASLLDLHHETVLRPLNLGDDEIDDLVAFLETLTGTWAEQPILSSSATGPP